jgi:hypothetical protein
MGVRRHVLSRRPLLAAALCLGPLAAHAQTHPAPTLQRRDLEAVGSALDRAVRQVSRPGPGAFAATGSTTRSYVLPGVGAVFVLAPRALPVRRVKSREAPTARALGEALAHLEESLTRVREPELRAQIERSLQAVRQVQADLHGAAPRPAWPPMMAWPPMPEIEQAMQAALAAQDQMLREAERQSREMGRAVRQQWEIEMRALSAQTDAFRQEAARVQIEAERALRDQLLQAWPDLDPVAIAPMLEPVPVAPPAPAAPAAPPGPPPAAAPAAPVAVAPPPAPAAPAPPWSFFFEPEDAADAGDADAMVVKVRSAVLHVLEGQGARLERLAPDESVLVAVDFLPRAGLTAAPPRTLVLRVRKQDLDERKAGRLAAEEFERRVVTTEY